MNRLGRWLVPYGTLFWLITSAPAFAADLTVWWTRGYYPEEDEGIRRIVADFEKDTGQSVALNYWTQEDLPTKVIAALAADELPDVVYCVSCSGHLVRWAHDGLLFDLTEVIEPIADQMDLGALARARLLNGQTGQRRYYTLPIVQASVHIHVWKSLLDRAEISLDEIPHEWAAFWDFWCDTVQPAVRKATGTRIYGIGQPVSTAAANDTINSFMLFLMAHDAYFMSPDGTLLFDKPGMRERIAEALEDYTRPAKRDCSPPGAASWGDADNNVNFLNQIVVMTPNASLSIPGSQRSTNPNNYYQNIATIEWPDALDGEPLTFLSQNPDVMVFAESPNPEGARDFLRHLMRPEQLGPYIEAAQGRWYPTMPRLAETAFWTNPADPHRAVLSRQMATHRTEPQPDLINWKYQQAVTERVWEKAIGRIVIDGWSAEAAADEAIARIKELVEQ
jgi:multiple sugar transport system substrate-binding protein